MHYANCSNEMAAVSGTGGMAVQRHLNLVPRHSYTDLVMCNYGSPAWQAFMCRKSVKGRTSPAEH